MSPAESTADLSSLDGMGMGRRGSGSMARNASTRSLATAPGSSLSKLESIASTAVRAADKVGVSMAQRLGKRLASRLSTTNVQEPRSTWLVTVKNVLCSPAA